MSFQGKVARANVDTKEAKEGRKPLISAKTRMFTAKSKQKDS